MIMIKKRKTYDEKTKRMKQKNWKVNRKTGIGYRIGQRWRFENEVNSGSAIRTTKSNFGHFGFKRLSSPWRDVFTFTRTYSGLDDLLAFYDGFVFSISSLCRFVSGLLLWNRFDFKSRMKSAPYNAVIYRYVCVIVQLESSEQRSSYMVLRLVGMSLCVHQCLILNYFHKLNRWVLTRNRESLLLRLDRFQPLPVFLITLSYIS